MQKPWEVPVQVNAILKPWEYVTLTEYMWYIDGPNQEACFKLYQDHQEKINTAKWSKIKHQAWEWWYRDHLEAIMKEAVRMYEPWLPFSLSDALLVLFLHDLEKPWKYAGNDEELAEFEGYEDYHDFINAKIEEYGIVLTDDHKNALKYIHGEWWSHNPTERIQWPLAAFVHICDTWSARVKPEYPLEGNRYIDRVKRWEI